MRLEEDAWHEVLNFQRQHHIESPNAAIRAMIDLAARDVVKLETALRRAAWREGTRNAARKLRDKMDKAVAETLGVVD